MQEAALSHPVLMPAGSATARPEACELTPAAWMRRQLFGDRCVEIDGGEGWEEGVRGGKYATSLFSALEGAR
jgi:hypothetical protein